MEEWLVGSGEGMYFTFGSIRPLFPQTEAASETSRISLSGVSAGID